MFKKLTEKFFLPAIAIAGLFFSNSAHAAVGPGTKSGEFLTIYSDARPAALGGAFTALAENAAGMEFNPAGLARAKHHEISASHVEWFENARFEHIAITMAPGPSLNTFGASAIFFDAGAFERTNTLGLPTGEILRARDYSVSLGYARKFRRIWNVGVALKFIRRELHSWKATALAGDIGVLYRPFDTPLDIGLVLQNLGGRLTFIRDHESLPLTLRAGVSYPFLLDRIKVTGDVIKIRDEETKFAGGVEAEIIDGLFARAGWNTEDGLMKGPALGGGARMKNISLDYAYVPYATFGGTHRFTGTFLFSGPSKPDVIKVPERAFPGKGPQEEKEAARPELKPEWKVSGTEE